MNCENVFETMVEHAIDYFETNDIHTAILGVSGGIDSTVVAYIFREVSKRLNSKGYGFQLIGISMPTETTDKDEFRISELVGNSICNDFKILDITNEAKSITVPKLEGQWDWVNTFRLGNVKSRLRMIHLYDMAKAFGGIVVGTDNYTEFLLGYSTIGGDGLFDYCPIQYLWKTEVYELANYFLEIEIANKRWDRVHAISESIGIPPQAGLGISKTDLEEIGAPDYYTVDTILKSIVDDTPIPEEIEIAVVASVVRRYENNKYKRNLPIVIGRDKFNF
jgi:NAD+ synthetase